MKRIKKYLENRKNRWTYWSWRWYRKSKAIEFAEKAAWWAEQAENANEPEERLKCALISQTYSASSMTFSEAK